MSSSYDDPTWSPEDVLRADRAAEIDARAPRECSICGCTDAEACVDQDTGEHCHWIIGNNVATCSFCAEELGEKNNLVKSYSEADARQFLKARILR